MSYNCHLTPTRSGSLYWLVPAVEHVLAQRRSVKYVSVTAGVVIQCRSMWRGWSWHRQRFTIHDNVVCVCVCVCAVSHIRFELRCDKKNLKKSVDQLYVSFEVYSVEQFVVPLICHVWFQSYKCVKCGFSLIVYVLRLHYTPFVIIM